MDCLLQWEMLFCYLKQTQIIFIIRKSLLWGGARVYKLVWEISIREIIVRLGKLLEQVVLITELWHAIGDFADLSSSFCG